jgi:hypothetical protein
MKTNNDKPTDENQNATEQRASEMPHIKGWAIDANPKNDPTFPMRQRDGETTKSYDWPRPTLQTPHTEILHSNERPNLTAVFGTSSPLSGLSGMIRRFAFRYSEGKVIHWLSLLLADRVNVAEGVADDFAKGRVPNLLGERGIKAQWKHNPEAVATKVIVGAAVLTAVYFLVKGKTKQ